MADGRRKKRLKAKKGVIKADLVLHSKLWSSLLREDLKSTYNLPLASCEEL
jgi:hypothetical protein